MKLSGNLTVKFFALFIEKFSCQKSIQEKEKNGYTDNNVVLTTCIQ